jgi:hypothetical protein
MAATITAGRLHQPLDLSLGEVLAGSIMPIWTATTPNFLFTVVGARARDDDFIGEIPLNWRELVP